MSKGRNFRVADIVTIYQAHGGVCALCGEPVEPADVTIDHIVPLVKGGAHERNNWQLAHRRCNSAKRDGPNEAFVARQQRQTAIKQAREAAIKQTRADLARVQDEIKSLTAQCQKTEDELRSFTAQCQQLEDAIALKRATIAELEMLEIAAHQQRMGIYVQMKGSYEAMALRPLPQAKRIWWRRLFGEI